MAALSRKQENDIASLDEHADHLTNEVRCCETHIIICHLITVSCSRALFRFCAVDLKCLS